MQALASLLVGPRARRVVRDRVLTDEVLPVFFFDDTLIWRNAIMCWAMRFNDILDPDRTGCIRVSHDSWSEKTDGESSGAEFASMQAVPRPLQLIRADHGFQKQCGKLEIHVLQSCSPKRLAMAFSHVSLDTTIDEHPLASKLPSPAHGPSLQTDPGGLESLCIPSGAPRTIDNYLTSDAPQLTLYVVSFSDATLVSMTTPHLCSNGMGLADLLEAWSLLLAGQDDKVEPMLSGCVEDPMSSAGLDPSLEERYVLEKKLLTGWKLALWTLRYRLGMVWRPTAEMKTIYLPLRACQKMKADVRLHCRPPHGQPRRCRHRLFPTAMSWRRG